MTTPLSDIDTPTANNPNLCACGAAPVSMLEKDWGNGRYWSYFCAPCLEEEFAALDRAVAEIDAREAWEAENGEAEWQAANERGPLADRLEAALAS
jgi:hypothetical protein